MTLIELVVTIAVMGAIATVLAAAVTVTFRQQAGTEGNLDVARWEQALALWLPTDLASADPTSLDTDGATAPDGCGAPCTASSNVLTLSFDDGSGATTVSYRYGPDPGGGDGYVMTRVECTASGCISRTVLKNLAAPTDPAWTAGDLPPTSVVSVSAPEQVVDGSNPDSGQTDGSAITVNVTVNGLPDAAGTARSSMVTVTAGGVERSNLGLPSFEGPSFVDARSGCGGPMTLIVDDSGSIVTEAGSYLPVRQGVESFVRALEGTPTQLTVIRFSGDASVLGTTGWTRSFDLAEPSDVFDLVGDTTPGVGGRLSEIGQGGATDWREALERAYLAEDGTPYADLGDPSQLPPELVVFFTDGVPVDANRYPDVIPPEFPDYPGWVRYPPSTDNVWPIYFSSWYSARHFADQHRDTARLVGVGLGQPFELGVVMVDAYYAPFYGRYYEPSGWTSYDVPVDVFLGDLVAGVEYPTQYDGDRAFELVKYDATNGWGDVSTAHLLTTEDLNHLGSGLAAIALAECGGTLTVQTRDSTTNQPADATVSYAVGAEQVETTPINKAGTFDIAFDGAPSKTVQLIPQSFDGTGLTPIGWSCRAGGMDLVEGSDWSLIGAGDPGTGVEVTVTPNAAVSCTLEVT